ENDLLALVPLDELEDPVGHGWVGEEVVGVERLWRDTAEYRLGKNAAAAVAVEEARLDLAELEDDSLRVRGFHALEVSLEVGPVARNEVFGPGKEHELIREDD